jgi:molecular chaperone GrpE
MTTRKHPHDPHEPERRSETVEPRDSRMVSSMEAQIQEKTAELESALAEAKDRHLRLAADFDNYKKRSRQEQLETIQHASADLIARLLPALDDLRKALDHKPEGVDEAWVKGLELSVRKLEEALGAHGLEPIHSVGKAFDPKLHEAIGYEESADQPEDTVTSELRRGYRIRDRVVRPALVKLARPPELPASDGEPTTA